MDSLLLVGENVLAVRAIDGGPPSFLDIKIVADAPDVNGDGVMVPGDNCPNFANTSQTNTDAANTSANRPGADTSGDACDDDDDGDGYSDAQEDSLAKDALVYCPIMRADVDGDGVVTIVDLGQVATDYGKQIPPAHPRYNQDSDNFVSIVDLAFMASKYLKPVTLCP